MTWYIGLSLNLKQVIVCENFLDCTIKKLLEMDQSAKKMPSVYDWLK
jgi:hypothetical protein